MNPDRSSSWPTPTKNARRTLAALREVGRPPVLVGVANIITVACVATVGYVHLSWLQLYGGITGIVLFGLPLVAALVHNASTAPAGNETSIAE